MTRQTKSTQMHRAPRQLSRRNVARVAAQPSASAVEWTNSSYGLPCGAIASDFAGTNLTGAFN